MSESLFNAELVKACVFRGIGRGISEAYKNQKMRCPVHLSVGQEFWLPFFGKYFEDGDRCFSSHRSHSMYMALECSLSNLIDELYGLSTGCLQGKGGSMHLKDLSKGLESSIPIVGSSIPLAVGSALSAKHSNLRIKSVAYFGDGACEEGVLHESLNLASIYKLPILFLCENNLYSCNTHLNTRQPSHEMKRFAQSAHIKSFSLNYNSSCFEIDSTFNECMLLSRREPIFLEIKSYRLFEHCGHNLDKESGDRTLNEFSFYQENDPINRLIQNNYFAKDAENKSFLKTLDLCSKAESKLL